MQFISNNGPFAGKEGKFVTSRNLRERLLKELKSNVALRVEETDSPDTFDVLGRGELHLSVLIETMRREGYELMVSQPQVIFKEGAAGEKLEPYEDVVIDVDESYTGAVIEELGRRGGRMSGDGAGRRRPHAARVRHALARSHRLPLRSSSPTRAAPASCTTTTATTAPTPAFKGRARACSSCRIPAPPTPTASSTCRNAVALSRPGRAGYGGQIVGLHSRNNDLIVNPSKAKKLTNIRTTAADEKLFLTPPIELTLKRRWSSSTRTSWWRSRPRTSACANAFSTTTSASGSKRRAV